jgi:hypothetical protein
MLLIQKLDAAEAEDEPGVGSAATGREPGATSRRRNRRATKSTIVEEATMMK